MMTFNEEDLISISALSHIVHCERRVALIHLEQLWEENLFTAEGRVLHERVDEEHHDSRGLYKIEYGMAIRSLEYGLIGKTDIVEIEKNPFGEYISIKPVEYKRGRKKEEDCDRVQLCAQALCLEEMFNHEVISGDFFYLQEHRRTQLFFNSELRERTKNLIHRIREILNDQKNPSPIYSKKKCDFCSLVDLCMPQALNNGGKKVPDYILQQTKMILLDGSE